MFRQRRRILSQNFLYNRTLVNKLIRNSSIGKNDIVLEIGPGTGIITRELLTRSRNVIAIEIDPHLYKFLKKQFSRTSNLQLICSDFLRYELPDCQYKVFANIPFSIEGKIIRKLLNATNPPEDCYLVMREDLAKRLSGFRQECQFSIIYKPWFTFEIVHYFKGYDFVPHTKTKCALLHFTKREIPLIRKEDKKRYIHFVCMGFNGGKRLQHNLKNFLTHEQFRRLSKEYKFIIRSRPSDLTLEQWIGMFDYLIRIGKI